MINKLIANYLKKFRPGKVPAPIFYEFSRLFYTIAVDLVVFDKNGYVLLTERDKKDPFWPNAYHAPGKIVIGSDKNYKDTLKRLIKQELPGIVITKPIFAADYQFYGKRGGGDSKVFIARLIKNSGYKFYNPMKLPRNTIMTPTIKIALSKIKSLS